MKKKHLCAYGHLFALLSCLMVPSFTQAQVTNPETWSSFVKSKANTIAVDTFRWQVFSESERNNWKYTVDGGAAVSEDKKGLKLPLSGSVAFEEYSLSCYDDVHMVIDFSVHSLVPSEDLSVIFSNNLGIKREGVLYATSKVEENVHYSKGIKNNPYYLALSLSEAAMNTKDGYIQLDSVYSYGSIPQYSLFTGRGNWNDTIRWSHLPPLRHRSALIAGSAEIDSKVQCKQAMLGGGSLYVTEKGHFTIEKLVLYNTTAPLTTTDSPLTTTDKALTIADNSLTVAGKLTINKQLEVNYTFPEKGKWYFLSFPFDVCMEGLDKRFQLKDQSFSGSGNYIYVQTYDIEKRALTQKAEGNWIVLSPDALPNDLLFEKGKGYLVALDAKASDKTLTFSTESSNVPESFGISASIPVYAPSIANADEAHCGWYLCGNPLPAPLSLSQITPDPALDGNIYLYDGTGYKSYPIGSNYVLPPFSAFFVKASADTEINLTTGVLPEDAVRLKSDYALRATDMEPTELPVHTSYLQKKTAKSAVKGNTLHLSDLPSAGIIQIADFAGRVVHKQSISSGSSTVNLSLPAGFYIINIVTDSYHAQHKCIIAH